ncbi:MAG: hypothetical protein JO149_06205 [Gammaproteobacteria bacterium]|nr:hypothetical protein [Gammaproteobacteria bacterium]
MFTTNSKVDWFDLPDEIKVKILASIKPHKSYHFGATNKANYTFFHEIMWKKYYELEFGFLDFKQNIKLQYFAAKFYSIAENCQRMDKAQKLYQKLLNFLEPHHNKPWVHYYLGSMYYHGKGLLCSVEKGINALKKGYEHADHRVTIKLAKLLIKSQNESRALLYNKLGDAVIENLLTRLILLHTTNSYSATYCIAQFYLQGICVERNDEVADKWLKKLITIDYEAGVKEWLTFRFKLLDQLNDTEVQLVVIKKMMDWLLIEMKFQPKSLVLNYYMSYIPYFYKNAGFSLNLDRLCLASDAGYFPAIKLLAQHYVHLIEDEEPTHEILYIKGRLIKLLKKGMLLGDRMMALKLNELATDPERYTFYQKSLFEGNHLAAELRAEHLKLISVHLLLPEDVVWLQLAAQHGSKDALDILFDLCEAKNKYALFALSILYDSGILFSPKIGPDKAIADLYWEMAYDVDNDIAENYQKVASIIDPHFLSEEVKEYVESVKALKERISTAIYHL